MDLNAQYEFRRQLLWGILLIAIGTGVLLDRFDMVDVSQAWHYWPLAMAVFGANRMVGFTTPRQFCSGLSMVLIGLWLYAVFEHLFGLTLHNSWPVLIVFGGLRLLLEPLVASVLGAHKE